MKAMIVLGHPVHGSFNHALAGRVAEVWQAMGYEIALHDLAAEGFDPCLTASEARGDPTENTLVQAHIATLCAADLLCVVHPNYWGSPPALVKGWVDRVFALHAAYTFPKGASEGPLPTGLLRLRAALVLNTGNTEQVREAQVFGDPLDRMWRHCVLGYCGVARTERRLFGVMATSDSLQRGIWLDEAAQLARELAQVPKA
jgi:putative NADPH-quinone reductase